MFNHPLFSPFMRLGWLFLLFKSGEHKQCKVGTRWIIGGDAGPLHHFVPETLSMLDQQRDPALLARRDDFVEVACRAPPTRADRLN